MFSFFKRYSFITNDILKDIVIKHLEEKYGLREEIFYININFEKISKNKVKFFSNSYITIKRNILNNKVNFNVTSNYLDVLNSFFEYFNIKFFSNKLVRIELNNKYIIGFFNNVIIDNIYKQITINFENNISFKKNIHNINLNNIANIFVKTFSKGS